jgi:pyruvate-formate lyase-activating enzyme
MIAEPFETMLTGGHPNSLGRTIEVVDIVMARPERLEELYACYQSDDEVVRMRVSNGIKRISRAEPERLVPYIDRFLTEITALDQASAQWTLAELFATLQPWMTADQQAAAEKHLKHNLAYHQDWIVINQTMQTLADWAQDDPELHAWLLPHLHRLSGDRRKSIAGRARKLINVLE